MYIPSELKVVLLPSRHLFQQVPGLFISICCSSSVNPSTAFCLSMVSPGREGTTFKNIRRIYPDMQVDHRKQNQTPPTLDWFVIVFELGINTFGSGLLQHFRAVPPFHQAQ